MKKLLLVIMLLSVNAKAQKLPTDDPTGFSSLVIQQAKNTQGGGSVRLSDGKVGSVAFLPIKTFHTVDGKLNWLLINAGLESLRDERPNGILFCSTDIVGVTNRL